MHATRTRNGVELPAPGTWVIDPGHAEVGFVGRHFGLTKIRGRFTGVDGAASIAERPGDSSVEVTIDMTTVSSGDHTRDDHLRSSDFFDVAHHPTAHYRSTHLDVTGTNGTMDGELTIKGITHPVRLQVEYLGHAGDPWGNDRAVFRATGTIDRHDWDLTWNMVLDAGGLLVSRQITLELEVELIHRPS